jgi:hypothetical protein
MEAYIQPSNVTATWQPPWTKLLRFYLVRGQHGVDPYLTDKNLIGRDGRTCLSVCRRDNPTRNLTNGETPSPDSIPNTILKNMPSMFHDLLFLLFLHCYKKQQILQSWKTSLIILLYKKADSTILTNH